ncbi:MAG TPA: hypothetical protein IAD42_06735 [Candidatus Scatomorpha pullistercoris]|uniref:Uncharacterized protein n=1 Tax=Candidatus Scatomorpha pullistercoris TaxID=2840929 RepID=A0A9D1G5E4_9FIRM|nr:hypothetical protein [Candidatus Scatomorpha pullistercoris]
MRKLTRTLLLAVVFSLCLTVIAFADVANGWTISVIAIGIPLLIIAAAVIVVAVLVKALRSRKGSGK